MRKAFFCFFLILQTVAYSQEGQFSQYFASSVVLNPAFAGTLPNVTFNTNFKRAGNPNSIGYLELVQATFTYPIKRTTSKDFQVGGAGISFFKERRGERGVFTAQKVLFTGSYVVKLSKIRNQSVIFGLQGGLAQNKVDGSNLRWGSQFNRYIGFDGTLSGEAVSSNAILYPVFNFGVIFSAFDNHNYLVRDKSILIGLGVDNLNEPTIRQEGAGTTQRFRVYKGFGSAKFQLGPRWHIHPSAYALYSRGIYQINGGLYFSTLLNSPRAQSAVILQFGTWYRLNDSIILLSGFELDNFKLSASIDLNATSFDINEALGNQLPSYEITLSYSFELVKKLRSVSNPIF